MDDKRVPLATNGPHLSISQLFLFLFFSNPYLLPQGGTAPGPLPPAACARPPAAGRAARPLPAVLASSDRGGRARRLAPAPPSSSDAPVGAAACGGSSSLRREAAWRGAALRAAGGTRPWRRGASLAQAAGGARAWRQAARGPGSRRRAGLAHPWSSRGLGRWRQSVRRGGGPGGSGGGD